MAVALDTRAWSEYPHSSLLWQPKTTILSISQVNRFTIIESPPESLDVKFTFIPIKRQTQGSIFALKRKQWFSLLLFSLNLYTLTVCKNKCSGLPLG